MGMTMTRAQMLLAGAIIVAAVLFAWVGRYEVTATQGGDRAFLYIFDRWHGTASACTSMGFDSSQHVRSFCFPVFPGNWPPGPPQPQVQAAPSASANDPVADFLSSLKQKQPAAK